VKNCVHRVAELFFYQDKYKTCRNWNNNCVFIDNQLVAQQLAFITLAAG